MKSSVQFRYHDRGPTFKSRAAQELHHQVTGVRPDPRYTPACPWHRVQQSAVVLLSAHPELSIAFHPRHGDGLVQHLKGSLG
jgi:hypothetical protein